MQKLGIIGLGRMGGCIAKRLLDKKTFTKDTIFFTTKHKETQEGIQKEMGIQACNSNLDLVKKSDILLLSVKPQNVEEVLKEVGKQLKNKILISIAASVSTSEIEKWVSKDTQVYRAMPNTPAFIGAGITALSCGSQTQDKNWEAVKKIFEPLGAVVRVDEKHMDAVTGLSGCGPAYLYVVLESLTDAGIKVGLPRDLATQLAGHTVLGAGKMLLETGRHPAALKDEVTTPAGCTIDGLLELEEGKLRVTLMKAVVKATERAKSLATKS